MGSSPDALLMFGYDFGSDEGVKLKEAARTDDNPFGEFRAPWYDPEAEDDEGHLDVFDQAVIALFESISDATPTDDRSEREKLVKARLGVWFETHCSIDSPMYALVAKVIRADWEDPKVVSLPSLATGIGEWSDRLAHALDVLGVTPTQDRPEWLLAPYYS